jgi:SAM-dependent methyltransferase
VHENILDPELRAILDAKGRADGRPVATNANALPVRRVLSLAQALARKPLAQSRVLDLACQEGCYALEAALAGAEAVGVEARAHHVARAKICAQRLGLQDKVRFEIGDVRAIDAQTFGAFDIVFFLGILYHLDANDAAETLTRLAGVASDLLIIDTHVALSPKATFTFRGRAYEGAYVREHNESDSAAEREKRLQASIDNTFSFYFTRAALARLLVEVGFSTVLEAHAPLDATKPEDRVTLAVSKAPLHDVQIYPWVAGLSEDALAETARPFLPPRPGGGRTALARLANRLLHPLGFTLARR